MGTPTIIYRALRNPEIGCRIEIIEYFLTARPLKMPRISESRSGGISGIRSGIFSWCEAPASVGNHRPSVSSTVLSGSVASVRINCACLAPFVKRKDAPSALGRRSNGGERSLRTRDARAVSLIGRFAVAASG